MSKRLTLIVHKKRQVKRKRLTREIIGKIGKIFSLVSGDFVRRLDKTEFCGKMYDEKKKKKTAHARLIVPRGVSQVCYPFV